MRLLPPITKNLLIINVLAYFAAFVLKARFGIDLEEWLGLHFFLASHFRVYQFFTYMFMHGSIEHLFFNMFALWMFGRIIEETYGARRYLFFYIFCGIGAGLVQEAVQYADFYLRGGTEFPLEAVADALNPWSTVGASGAVYGILLAFGMNFPEERMFIFPIPIPIKAKYFVAGYAVVELALAMLRSNDGVAHMAHLGGMLFGLLLILHWRNPNRGLWGYVTKKMTEWKKPRMKVSRGGDKFADEMDYNARRKAQDAEIDRILEKVKKRGYGSLTEEEKRKLFNASGRK